MATSAMLNIIRIVVAMFFGAGLLFGGHRNYGTFGGFGIGLALLGGLSLLTFLLWLVCIIKAATGSRFVLPVTGPIAENMVRS